MWRKSIWGFLGSSEIRESAANAGNMGSIPDPGRSHMPWSNQACVPQLLSLCSRAQEPQLLSPPAATSEACTPYSPGTAALEALPLTRRGKSLTATKTQHSQK